jgi:AcrR family transcriptional regulator
MSQRRTMSPVDAPAVEGDVRRRILDAARKCYTDRGVLKTTVEDIAGCAQVHRVTVYSYFRNRNDILADVLLEEFRPVIANSTRIMSGPEPFADRMVESYVNAQRMIMESPLLAMLFDRENAAFSVRAGAASAVLAERTREGLTKFVADAMANGELRDDVPPEAIARWLMRVHDGLTMNPPHESETGAEGVLRRFVLPSILASAI